MCLPLIFTALQMPTNCTVCKNGRSSWKPVGVEGGPTHCSKCKVPSMTYCMRGKCVCGKSYPSFNFVGIKPAKFCTDCKSESMVNVLYSMCHACGVKQRTHGYPDMRSPSHCSRCASPGMVNIRTKKCSTCDMPLLYGVPNKAPSHCSRCYDTRVHVIHPLKKCEVCKKTATHMSGDKRLCVSHRCESAICLQPSECSACGDTSFLADGVCFTCSGRSKRIKETETCLLGHLQERSRKGGAKYVHDRRPNSETKKRPDFFV